MTTVRVNSDLAVILPASILELAGVKQNDVLEAQCVNGVITLTPQPQHGKSDELMAYAGVAARAFGSAADTDQLLLRMRSEWER